MTAQLAYNQSLQYAQQVLEQASQYQIQPSDVARGFSVIQNVTVARSCNGSAYPFYVACATLSYTLLQATVAGGVFAVSHVHSLVTHSSCALKSGQGPRTSTWMQKPLGGYITIGLSLIL